MRIDQHYLDQARTGKISHEETVDLCRRASTLLARGRKKQAGALHQQVVAGNLLLVVRLVNLYYRHSGMDPNDLVAEGNIALIKSVATYDPDQSRFSYWAQGYIRGHLRQIVRAFHRWYKPLESVQAPDRPDSQEHTSVSRRIDRMDERRRVIWAMRELDERERLILRKRFGHNELLLKQVGTILGIGKARVRQVEIAACENSKRRFHEHEVHLHHRRRGLFGRQGAGGLVAGPASA